MRTLTDGGLSVVCFDENVYTQEKLLIYVTEDNGAGDDLLIEDGSIQAHFTLDSNGKATIDLSDYIRSRSIGQGTFTGSIYVEHESGDGVYVTWHKAGLLNPANFIIPFNPKTPNAGNGKICFPTMMYQSIGGSVSTSAEWFGYSSTDGIELRPSSLPSVSAAREMVLPASCYQYTGMFTGRAVGGSLKPLPCDRRFAAVQWLSRSGVTKRHTWEVVGVTDGSENNVDLLVMDSGYHVLKGQIQSMTLRLDNLTAYDYWYYSDIVTSSDVRVMLDAALWNNGIPETERVNVTTKSVKQPDGNEFYTLEIEINFKHYDTI